MDGTKQCPQCECTDVPFSAELCPFCGYSFGKQPKAKPAEAERQPEARQTEEEKPPVKPVMDAEDEAPMPGEAAPASTEYKTYQKKGKKKQKDSSASQQGQENRTIISVLAVALAVTAVCMMSRCMYQGVYVFGMGMREGQLIIWERVLAGVLAASMHYCCFGGDKGSRKAGIVGIIAGNIWFICCIARENAQFSGMSISYAFSRYGWTLLSEIVVYMVCWLMAAKLAKNSKSAVWFCLTAVEIVGLPYLLSWVRNFYYFYYYRKELIGSMPRLSIDWLRLAVICVVMLLMEFLLYRVRAWLAVKSRRPFWVLYLVVVIGILVFMFSSLNTGWLRRFI